MGAERSVTISCSSLSSIYGMESRSPLRSRSDDLPLPLLSQSTLFFEPRSPLRSAHLTFLPAPLRTKVGFYGVAGGEGQVPDIPTKWVSEYPDSMQTLDQRLI